MTSRKTSVEEEAAAFTNPAGEPDRETARAPRLANPMKEPIDIRALHEEISADFPKTLARLAE